jgi:hypothetical protein
MPTQSHNNIAKLLGFPSENILKISQAVITFQNRRTTWIFILKVLKVN